MDLSEDAFLDGKIKIKQPRKGHRSGHEAVLLAASINPSDNLKICELGAGAGVATLCAATRLGTSHVTGIEINTDMHALAQENAIANKMQHCTYFIKGDIVAPFRHLNLMPSQFDYIIANPPFYDPQHIKNTVDKRVEHIMNPKHLEAWIKCACTLVKADGRINFIHRAESLPRLLTLMTPRMGDIYIKPISPKINKAAHRVIISGKRDSRTPLQLLPPLYLHTATGTPTQDAENILRHGHGLFGLD